MPDAGLIEDRLEIEADPDRCLAVVSDFASYPEWQEYFKSVEIRKRDKEGRGKEVAYQVDLLLTRVRYVLEYDYKKRPLRLGWRFKEGDVRDIEGSWEFRKLGEGRTEATFRLRVDPGRFVPALVARTMTTTMVKTSLSQFKKRVENV